MPTEGRFAKAFQEQLTPAQRADLLDVVYIQDAGCFLFHDKIRCQSGNSSVEKRLNSSFRPVGFLTMTKSLSFIVPPAVYLVDDSGALQRLPETFEAWRGYELNNPIRVENLVPLSGAVAFGDQYLLLTQDQKLLKWEPSANNWLEVAADGDKQIYKKLIGPFEWSKKLEEL